MVKATLFYQHKKTLDSPCLECGSLCNTILELKDLSDFHCCVNCARKTYKFKKSNSKTPPKTRKSIFRTKSCVKNRNKGIVGVGHG